MRKRRVLWAIVYVLIGAASIGVWAFFVAWAELGSGLTFLYGALCGAVYMGAGLQHWRRAEEREIAGAVE